MKNCLRFLSHLLHGVKKDERKALRFTLHHVFFINLAVIVILLSVVASDVYRLPNSTSYAQKPPIAIAPSHMHLTKFTQITSILSTLPSNNPTIVPSKIPTPTLLLTLTPKQAQNSPVSPTRTPTSVPQKPPQNTSDAVQYLLNLLNSERAKNGASALSLDGTLSGCAFNHAKQLADRNALFHDLQNDVCDASHTKGENVGMASTQPNTSIDTIHSMMVAEKPSGHWAIMVDPRFTHVGLGIYVTNTGTWLSEDFGG